jgi:hypothetical protein
MGPPQGPPTKPHNATGITRVSLVEDPKSRFDLSRSIAAP